MARMPRFPVDDTSRFEVGLSQIRNENNVPDSFPEAVLAAAAEAVRRPFGAEHVDRTDLGFVTLDPASSTDLDQAFSLENAAGGDMVLRYAIADVGWFVEHGSVLDIEAHRRGVTIYLPDRRAPLYPPSMSEAAVSLLPDGPRPAVIFVIRVDSSGWSTLDGVERAMIRSRAKLAYETATAADLPEGFADFAQRIAAAEDARGASRVESPEQEMQPDGNGGYRLAFRPRLKNEDANAAMSLATNLAVADALFAAGTGLFRVMAEPDDRAVKRLRYTAKALRMNWPADEDLQTFERDLDPHDPTHAAFSVAVRRATGGADYAPFQPGVTPWHAAMAATYSHTTAPLRRLADRYVVEAALALANSKPVPEEVQQEFSRLPEVMDRAEAVASRVERAAIDLVEAVVLAGNEGKVFDAVVTDTDERGARVQLRDPAVVARVSARGVDPGDELRIRLVSVDPVKRQLSFERVS